MPSATIEKQSATGFAGPSAQDIADFERDGYFIARGLYTAAEVAEMRDTFMDQAAKGHVDGLFDGATDRDSTDPLARFPRMMHPHRQAELKVGKVATKYMLDSRIEAYLTGLLGDEPIAAQSMFYFKPGGARGQALHQDNFYLRVKPGTCMAAWTAVDRSAEDNGGLMVVPGSHKADVVCPKPADPTVSFTSEYVAPPEGMNPVPLTLGAGDVLFFGGSVIHGSYPNASDDFRRAFICHYIPRGSVEASHWYKPMVAFNGQDVNEIGDAVGGGPCGSPEAALGPH